MNVRGTGVEVGVEVGVGVVVERRGFVRWGGSPDIGSHASGIH